MPINIVPLRKSPPPASPSAPAPIVPVEPLKPVAPQCDKQKVILVWSGFIVSLLLIEYFVFRAK